MKKKLIADARKRQLELEQLINELENKKLKIHAACPNGTIKINHNRGRIQYYLKEYGRKGKEKYLKKDQVQIVHQIAQRDYEKQVVKAARAELECINNFLKGIPDAESVSGRRDGSVFCSQTAMAMSSHGIPSRCHSISVWQACWHSR